MSGPRGARSSIKAVCFDYYGTLVDVGEPFIKIKDWFAEFLERENSEVKAENFNFYFSKQRAKYIKGTVFLTGHDILEKSYLNACRKFNVKPALDEFNSFAEDLFINPAPFEDTISTIEALKEKYTISVITNADNVILYKNIIKNKFLFDYVVSSEDIWCYKPNHMIFNAVFEKLQLKAGEVMMIGDSISEDISPAKELGFKTIWLNTRNGEELPDCITVNSLKEILWYV